MLLRRKGHVDRSISRYYQCILSAREVKAAKVQEINRGMQNDGIVEQLKAKYRRAIDIKYFDEIAKEWEKKADS